MKKLLSMLLAACMAFVLLPVMGISAASYTIAPATGGNYGMTNGNSYTINGTYSVSNYGITLSSGSATLTINGNVTIDNRSYTKNPIAVTGSATLTLVVNSGYTLTVYGGHAAASVSRTSSVQTRAGAYAGIRVLSAAKIIISGAGTVKAYGGNADFGGAGAGIGGNGGTATVQASDTSYADGGTGESSGQIFILSSRVEAYGGAGGVGQTARYLAGGYIASETCGSGYPAAGIGGGGAGGGSFGGLIGGVSWGSGGGGFNGGSGAAEATSGGKSETGGAPGANGNAGSVASYAHYAAAPGGGYFGKAVNKYNSNTGKTSIGGVLGGGRSTWYGSSSTAYYSGQGGQGGAGNAVRAASDSTVTAYNGSYSANATATAANQTPIYAQIGYTSANIRAKIETIPSSYRTASTLPNYLNNTLKPTKSVTTTSFGLGLGSGAGYTEGGNGSYAVQSAKPGAPNTIASGNGALGVYGWTAPAYNALTLTNYQVNVYSDAACTSLVKSAMTGSVSTWSAASPFQITGLTGGTTYYVKVVPYYGDAPGTASDAVSGIPFTVAASPMAGAYYRNVSVSAVAAGTAQNGYTPVYSVDGKATWTSYTTSFTITQATTVYTGARKSDGTVLEAGSAAYTLFDVSATPASGAYYQKVDMQLATDPAGADIAATGHELVYSTDGGTSWTAYPAAGVSFTAPVTVRYGVRRSGVVTEAGSRDYKVFDVSCSPAAGSYYKKVDVQITGVGVKESGGTLVYSTDGGSKWNAYSASGLTLTKSATLCYGVRLSDGTVHQVGERTYMVSPHAVAFSSLTLHNNNAGTGAALSMSDISGLTGQITAKLTGVTSYTSDAGYIVLALYGEGGRLVRTTLTPIGGRSDDVVSEPITLPDGMTSAYGVRAFVLGSFADMTPVGKIASIGKRN